MERFDQNKLEAPPMAESTRRTSKRRKSAERLPEPPSALSQALEILAKRCLGAGLRDETLRPRATSTTLLERASVYARRGYFYSGQFATGNLLVDPKKQ